MATRTLEAYWQGFCGWLLGRRHWRPGRSRSLHERIEGSALDVAESLVALRHGQDPIETELALDRLELWIEVAARAGRARSLSRREVAVAREALRTARGLLPRPRRSG